MTSTQEKTYDKEEIKELLKRDDKKGKYAVMKAVVVIYNLQTQDEKASGETHHWNGVGFNGVDASYLTYIAKWVLDKKRLDEPHLTKVRKRIVKYAGQLAKIANGEINVEASI